MEEEGGARAWFVITDIGRKADISDPGVLSTVKPPIIPAGREKREAGNKGNMEYGGGSWHKRQGGMIPSVGKIDFT